MKKISGSGLVILLVITILSVGLSASCGSTTTTSTSTTPSTTGTSTTPPSQGTTSASISTSLPRYEPSEVVSDAPGSLQLTSSDSIQKVTAFYDEELARGSWSIISDSKTAYSTNITAKQGGTGTTLSISATGSGCYISLVTYPI